MKSLLSHLFLFVFVLFLPSQLSRHFWPAASFISGIPIDYLSPTLYLTDFIAFIFIILFLPQINKFIKNIPLQSWLFGGIFIFVNCLFSLSPAFTFYKWIRVGFYFLTGLSLWFAVPKFSKTITLGLAGSVIWVSILAWAQFLQGGSLGSLWTYLGERPLSTSMPLVAKVNTNFGVFLRPYATFPHPNALAGYLLVSCLLIYFYLIKKNNFQLSTFNFQLLLKTGLYIGIFTILITFSPPSIFLEAAFIITIIIKKLRLPYVISLLLIILLSFGLFWNLRLSSVSERVYLFKKSLSAISTHPLTGVGLGNFPLYSYPLNHFPLQLSWQPVHNLFLLLLSELGIPSAFIIFYLIFKYCLKIKKINIVFLYSVICILFTGMFDHYWLTSHQNIMLLLLAPAMVKFPPE